MKSKICDENLDLPEIICSLCKNKIEIMSPQFLDFVIDIYKDYKNRINYFSKDYYDDNYKTRAIKKTHLEIFNELINILEFGFKEYTNIKVSEIEIENMPVKTPSPCQQNRNKICDGCMDC
jgi:hypothetical protein